MHRSMRVLCLAGCLASLALVPGYGFDFSQVESQITEHTLDNGLKIIVLERHEAPVATFMIWANVGSVDDPKGYTGLAHMFEHLAFKGTQKLGTKNWEKERKLIAVEDSLFLEYRAAKNQGRETDSAEVADLYDKYEAARESSYEMVEPNKFLETYKREGGENFSAGTGYDFTMFFFSLPANKAELWMAMESERFHRPVFREMYKERDVVAEERRMRVESSPIGRMLEQFLGLAYNAHPYGISGIGHMSDIMYYSRDEASDFFRKYYGPSNLVISIVGDVKADDMFKMAEKYWSPIQARPKPQRIATVEPEQAGERRMVLEDPSQPVYMVGWHVPSGTHPDRPALNALTQYLATGRTSALYERMVKEEAMAIQVGAFAGFPGNKYPGMAIIYAIPAKDHTNAECESVIFEEVERVKDELLDDSEIEKIRARAKAQFIEGLRSNVGMAAQLASFETEWGSWKELFKQLDRINAVTAEDIQRVAQMYFTKENRNVVMMNTAES